MFLYDRTINTSQLLLAAHENHYQARRTQEQKRLLMHYTNEFNARNSLMKNNNFDCKTVIKIYRWKETACDLDNKHDALLKLRRLGGQQPITSTYLLKNFKYYIFGHKLLLSE